MREWMLLAAVGVACGAALVNPRVGLYAYIGFALLRPDALAWSEGRYPYSLALVGATLLSSIRHAGDLPDLVVNPVARGFLLLQVPIALSVVFSLEPSFSYGPYRLYIGIAAISCSIPLLIRTERELKNLLEVMGLSMGLLAIKFAVYGLRSPGVRFEKGWVGLLADNNDLALALVMTLPLCWYMGTMVQARWLKGICLAMALSSGLVVVMTRSRGGTLALVAVLLLMTLRAKRKIIGVLLLSVLAGVALYVGGDAYLQRLATLRNPQADASAVNRMYVAGESIRVWQEYPWGGVGFGGQVFQRLELPLRSDVRPVAHNTYLEMLVDSGIFAFLFYTALLLGTIAWLGRSARQTKAHCLGMEVYPLAIQTSLVGFAVGATFLSRVGFDYQYFLLMSAGSWWEIEKQLSRMRDPEISGRLAE
jgi:probable O-glycosylation ligase (exosortase A-associated)